MNDTPRRHTSSRPGRISVGLTAGLCLLSGCAATDVTTHRGFQATSAGFKGTSYILRATGRASVTAPDTPRLTRAVDFFKSQRQQLARESAVGGGEDIQALGFLLGKKQPAELARWMQAHYATLFSDRTVAASTVVARIDAHVE